MGLQLNQTKNKFWLKEKYYIALEKGIIKKHNYILDHSICCLGFEGKNCEININECLQSGCQEQEPGVKYCVDRINDYQCVCEDGFTGKNCQINKGRSQLIFLLKSSCPSLACKDKIN